MSNGIILITFTASEQLHVGDKVALSTNPQEVKKATDFKEIIGVVPTLVNPSMIKKGEQVNVAIAGYSVILP